MCGIGGIKRFAGGAPIGKSQIQMLLCELERRGNDAAGVALVNNGEDILVCKSSSTPWEFVAGRELNEFLDSNLGERTRCALVHTRLATLGSPQQEANNHPLYKQDSAVIHNGVIDNHEDLFKRLQLVRNAVTDSDIIRAVVDKYGMSKVGVRMLGKMDGSIAAAVVSNSEPKRLMLLRSGNPLVFALLDGQLVWASEKSALHAVLRPYEELKGMWVRRNVPDAKFGLMPRDTAWILGDTELEEHWQFETCRGYFERERATYSGYSSRKLKWPEEKDKTIDTKAEVANKPMAIHFSKKRNATCPKCKRRFRVDKAAETGDIIRCVHDKCRAALVIR